MTRILLAGADVVLPGRVAAGLTIVVEGDRIVDLASGALAPGPDDRRIDLSGHLVVPGFVDTHVHGIEGIDALDGDGAVAAMAARLPRWGVTAFCPTTVACTPQALEACLDEISRLRSTPPAGSARVLGAHVESAFINPSYRGAQPAVHLRAVAAGADVLDVIDRRRTDVATVTIAPEIDDALSLVRRFAAAGVRVSIGHSGATYDEAQAAIAAGATGATHLFNRMRPITHRDPGIAGAVLASPDVAAEIICDCTHVHPAMLQTAIAAKGASRTLAITDGTAGSGLAAGARARLGGQSIVVGDVARLDDGTMAGSVLTMDQAFSRLVTRCGLDLPRAAEVCATSPARALNLQGLGVIGPGAFADLAVLDSRLRVVQTWVAGRKM
jgi:N-acetylglucosamine-6-phosphate deacetylase